MLKVIEKVNLKFNILKVCQYNLYTFNISTIFVNVRIHDCIFIISIYICIYSEHVNLNTIINTIILHVC